MMNKRDTIKSAIVVMLIDFFVWYHLYVSLGFSKCYTRKTVPDTSILSRPNLKMSIENKTKWYLKFSDHGSFYFLIQ